MGGALKTVEKAAKANLALSKKRAEAVRQWEIENMKVPADRLDAQGYGDQKPIAPNDTEEGRAKNRRVDFTVTAK
ncbi:MAG: OmpA family protein [Elusimicrobiota bacterium]